MEPEEIGSAVRNGLDRDALVADLAEWVRLETPTHDTAASAAAAALLEARWRPFGTVGIESTPAGSHVLVDVPGHARTDPAPVVLLGHSDTVWPVGTLAGPVPLRITPDAVAGPGAYDMKAGLVAMLAAVTAITEQGLPHPPLRVVIAADEEVGSGSASALVRTACAGARGVLGFESPHPDGSLKVGRLGSTRLRLRITGQESHAALDPEAGTSAIEELVDQLLDLRRAMASLAARHPGAVLYNAGAISGGGRTNVIPGAAEALVGLRLGSSAAEADVLEALAALRPHRPAARVETEILSARPAWQASAGDAGLLAAVAAVSAALGEPLTGRPAAGAADTNTTGALGVPTLDGFGPMGGGAHAASEHVMVDSLLDRIVLLATFLTQLPDAPLDRARVRRG